jgi:hypothetical protein
MVRCQNPQGPFGGCVPVQMGANGTAVANQKLSETGGTAEDDVNAIVDAAEESQQASDDSGLDLFDKVRAKSRNTKKAARATQRKLQRKEHKVVRKANKAAPSE